MAELNIYSPAPEVNRPVSKPRKSTKAEAEAELARAVAQIRTSIAYVTNYIDTIYILMERPLPRDRLDVLEELLPGRVQYKEFYYRSYSLILQRLNIIQPSDREIIKLIDRYAGKHKITRVDSAFDLIPLPKVDPANVQQQIKMLLTQTYRGSRTCNEYEGTDYLGPQKTTRNVALYSDKLSKIEAIPCVHVETRHWNAKTCRSNGIHRIGDLLDIDHTACLDKDARLSVINWRLVEDRIAKMAHKAAIKHRVIKNRFAYFSDQNCLRRRIQHRTCRLFQDEEGIIPDWDSLRAIPTQDLLDEAPLLRHRNAAVQLPFSALLTDLPVSTTQYDTYKQQVCK